VARIQLHAAFKADVAAQLAFLEERGDVRRAEGLLQDLKALSALVSDFPEAGRELHRVGDQSLRMMPLRRASYVAWYVASPEKELVTLYRLYHDRQSKPEPHVPVE
jgi:plasmid stabilization system protein ParE